MYKTRQHAEVAASVHGLANVLESQGKYGEAEAAYLESIKIQEAAYKTRQHASVVASLANFGFLLLNTGQPTAALPAVQEAWSISLAVDSKISAIQIGPTLYRVLQALGREDEAAALRDTVAQLLTNFPEDHPTRRDVAAKLGLGTPTPT